MAEPHRRASDRNRKLLERFYSEVANAGNLDLDMVQFAGGVATAHWGVSDSVTLMRQLGVIPPA
jgi:hypothetical protein